MPFDTLRTTFIELLLYAFITFIIETCIFILFYRKKIKKNYLILVSLLVNFITNLSLNSVLVSTKAITRYGYFKTFTYGDFVFWGEIIVLIVEYIMYVCAFKKYIKNKKISGKTLLGVTLLANAFSFLAGIIATNYIDKDTIMVILVLLSGYILSYIAQIALFRIKYKKIIDKKYITKITILANFITDIMIFGSVLVKIGNGSYRRLLLATKIFIVGKGIEVFVEYFLYKYAYSVFVKKKEITKNGLFVLTFCANLIAIGLGALTILVASIF